MKKARGGRAGTGILKHGSLEESFEIDEALVYERAA